MYLIKSSQKVLREQGLLTFINKASRYVGRETAQFVSLPFCQSTIRKYQRHNTIDELVDFSFYRFYGLIMPFQKHYEITSLLSALEKARPKTVLEIGTWNGGTLFLFTHVASPDARIASIDLPGGAFGGGYPAWKIPLYKSFVLPGQTLNLIRADSHSRKTLEKTEEYFGKEKVDFLFIDGDHSYEGVKRDFEMYSPLVKKDGYIAFHDIVKHPPETGCEVNRFWTEIKSKYETSEIVEDWEQKGCGIGLIKYTFL